MLECIVESEWKAEAHTQTNTSQKNTVIGIDEILWEASQQKNLVKWLSLHVDKNWLRDALVHSHFTLSS